MDGTRHHEPTSTLSPPECRPTEGERGELRRERGELRGELRGERGELRGERGELRGERGERGES